ncbi:MAG: crAss001_48 related protein [Cetobacterium sp.]
MVKFKVGDRVRIAKKSCTHYYWMSDMLKTFGKVGTISKIMGEVGAKVRINSGKSYYEIWAYDNECLELVASNEEPVQEEVSTADKLQKNKLTRDGFGLHGTPEHIIEVRKWKRREKMIDLYSLNELSNGKGLKIFIDGNKNTLSIGIPWHDNIVDRVKLEDIDIKLLRLIKAMGFELDIEESEEKEMRHIERMEKELNELQIKIQNGMKFYYKELESPTVTNEIQRASLTVQLTHMQNYARVLYDRIEYDRNKEGEVRDKCR